MINFFTETHEKKACRLAYYGNVTNETSLTYEGEINYKTRSNIPEISCLLLHQKILFPNDSLINKILNYKTSQLRCKSTNHHKFLLKDIQSIGHCLDDYLMNDLVSDCVKICSLYISTPNVIINAILYAAQNDHDNDVSRLNLSTSIKMSLNHKKLLILTKELNRKINCFDLKLLECLEKRIFCLKAGRSKKLESTEILSLTHFYLGLAGQNIINLTNKAMWFIYKAFYYFSHLSYAIAYIVFKTLPNCLPQYTNKDESAFISIIIHTIMIIDSNSKDIPLNVVELQNLITQQYGYPEILLFVNNVISELILKMKSHSLNGISFSFILLSKRYGYKWALKYLIHPFLIPSLNRYLKMSEKSKIHDDQIICCIDIVSEIAKTLNIKSSLKRESLYFIKLFEMVLKISRKPPIQEAAIKGILRLSRFGAHNIYVSLLNWNPTEEVSRELLMMLVTFSYRKPLKYWLQMFNKFYFKLNVKSKTNKRINA